jgi:hypothetical protein
MKEKQDHNAFYINGVETGRIMTQHLVDSGIHRHAGITLRTTAWQATRRCPIGARLCYEVSVIAFNCKVVDHHAFGIPALPIQLISPFLGQTRHVDLMLLATLAVR